MNVMHFFNKKGIAKRISEAGNFPYGIITLLMCALTVFFSGPGQTYFVSVFLDHYIGDFGWSRSMISGLYSAATLLSGLLLFLVGRLADKYGSRTITLIAALLLGISSFLSSMLVSPIMLFIVFFMGRLNGQGTLSLMPSTIIPRWFNRRRALAFSLMSLGSVAGSAFIPPLNNHLILMFGWRTTWKFWAFAIWLVFIPLAYLFLFNDPKQLRSAKAVNMSEVDNVPKQDQKTKFDHVVNWSLREAMRTFVFWAIIIIQMLNPMISTGITFHFMSIMKDKGIVSANVPFLLSIMALTSLPATLLAGVILNKVKTMYGGILFTIFLNLSIICLLFVSNMPGAVFFAILQGISQGIQVVWGGLVWPDYFGMKNLGSIRGFAMSTAVISSSMGPLLFGAIFDLTSSYSPVLVAAVIMTLVGLVLSIVAKPPHQKTFKNNFLS
ncbi:MAG: MFS transporter [Bacillota bacterium]|nr:MFS transporter [Bacillota bacterium]